MHYPGFEIYYSLVYYHNEKVGKVEDRLDNRVIGGW